MSQLFISRMPKMRAIPQLVSAPLNPIPIAEHFRRSHPPCEHSHGQCMVFGFKGVYTLQLIREHSFGYKIFTLNSELKISGHTIKPKRFDFRFMNLRFFDFLPHFGPCFCSNSCSKKKKMCGIRQFHTPFFSGVFCTFTARCF